MTSLAATRRGRVQLTRNGGTKARNAGSSYSRGASAAKPRKGSNSYRGQKGEGGVVAARMARGAGFLAGRMVVLSLLLALVSTVSLGLLYGYRWLTVNPYFSLRQVEVTGNSRLSRDEVLKLAGVSGGENTLELNIRDVESRISSDPWIKSVTVERVLPGTLKLTIAEKQAAFWVQRGTTLYYAEADGDIIAPVEADHFASLPVLELLPGSESWLDDMPLFAAELAHNRWFFSLRDIELMQAGGGDLTLVLSDGRTLSLDLSDWEGGLDRMKVVADDLSRRNEWNFVRHMQASGGRVWVRLAKTGA